MKQILLILLILFPIATSADIFLEEATIIGNPADHTEVVSFAIPAYQSWETGIWDIGYRVWLNEYQMTVLTVKVLDESVIWSTCELFNRDLSQVSGVSNRECNIEELSTTLFYMPEVTLKTLNIYWNK